MANGNIAIITLPSGIADFLAIFVASVMSTIIITRLAIIHAFRAEVVVSADESVFELEKHAARTMDVVDPRLARRQSARVGQTSDQLILTFASREKYMPRLEDQSNFALPEQM